MVLTSRCRACVGNSADWDAELVFTPVDRPFPKRAARNLRDVWNPRSALGDDDFALDRRTFAGLEGAEAHLHVVCPEVIEEAHRAVVCRAQDVDTDRGAVAADLTPWGRVPRFGDARVAEQL